MTMEIDTRFASKLDSVHDVSKPMRGALEKVPSRESIRLLVHAPGQMCNRPSRGVRHASRLRSHYRTPEDATFAIKESHI
jgi:hypothetical protein